MEHHVAAVHGARSEIRCSDCGYGAVVSHRLSSCPMCGGGDWRVVRAVVTAGGRAARL